MPPSPIWHSPSRRWPGRPANYPRRAMDTIAPNPWLATAIAVGTGALVYVILAWTGARFADGIGKRTPGSAARVATLWRTVRRLELVVIDGYVWLAKDQPGLGAHLYERFGGRYPVAGVANGAFRNNDCAIAVTRGGSTRPLYVTAAGIDAGVVAEGVARMAGPHRMPTILKRVPGQMRTSYSHGFMAT